MSFEAVELLFLLIGLMVYGAIVFWTGIRGLWWVAALASAPAVMGGLIWFSLERPAEPSFISPSKVSR